jgi:predicted DNA-binding ribbon-helix-helix protein
MCNIYTSTAPERYECQTRSIRIQGMVTSVRLENEFWKILEEIAVGESCGVPQFLNTLYNEVIELRGEVSNFASLLRVVCLVYMAGNRGPLRRLGLLPYLGQLPASAVSRVA